MLEYMQELAAHAYYGNTKIPNFLAETHIDVWAFSLEKATRIYPPKIIKIKKYDGKFEEEDTNQKSRMILAQVYYKALMDKIE